MWGPGPRLIKKEFTGPRSHKVREILPYSLIYSTRNGDDAPQNDITTLVVGFRSFADAPKITTKFRGEFRPRQTRQLPRAVDLKGRLLSCQSY